MYRLSPSRRLFLICNYIVLSGLSVICLLPLINILAISFSSSGPAIANLVKFWPVEFTFSSYKFIMHKQEFLTAMVVTLKRFSLGTIISMVLTLLAAYALSKEESAFKGRTLYAWIFMLTILFNGGLIPWYIAINQTGMLDTIWALVIPNAVQVFNVILLLNFFRGLPKELEEAAFIDGASHLTTLIRVFIPVSAPALATITLFTIVYHWNSWFDGLLLMNSPAHYPLQSYLQTVTTVRDLTLVSSQSLNDLKDVSDRTSKSAQLFLGALPILFAYPFLQRYFIKGIVLGSVKE
ncbi:carbohydrate ABC transporter permease [Cohnella silvisoli]|uniref:Carbohydrate ABC transporter permease n=1 Tax=Cohnella silvisoli TaxID=2873699 RepID=A0ABV1KXY4_9BACL|nr:carbohydrate ABC transporter permease [Cohnella silvisoli]MCD9024230.1 carbohydrate ABC transporter permease [Cohnella silvisoli]